MQKQQAAVYQSCWGDNDMEKRDLLIIGAGPAGLSAAIAAKSAGFQEVLILDRLPKPGGILPQCFHRGFRHPQREIKLTGPEYVEILLQELGKNVEIRTDSTVLEITDKGIVTVAGNNSIYRLSVRAIILATGCRERSIGSLPIYGSRPTGVFTAGSVQKMLNLSGYHIGRRAVVLGSGDVGMIAAHHLTESGTQVLAVIEKEQRVGGLIRNKRQFIDPHGITLLTGHTITTLHGKGRLKEVTVCKVDREGKPILDTAYRLECDALISSVGLIPELELISNIDVPWIFVCGNARRIHSLIRSVITEGTQAANLAVSYLSDEKSTIS